jgi:hypothetical protein
VIVPVTVTGPAKVDGSVPLPMNFQAVTLPVVVMSPVVFIFELGDKTD